MALVSTQPLTEMSTRNLPGGKGRPARKADNLTAICEPIVLNNVGDSTSHNPMGLHGLLTGIALPYFLPPLCCVYKRLLLGEVIFTNISYEQNG
jgi:hypothetical protein